MRHRRTLLVVIALAVSAMPSFGSPITVEHVLFNPSAYAMKPITRTGDAATGNTLVDAVVSIPEPAPLVLVGGGVILLAVVGLLGPRRPKRRAASFVLRVE